MSRCTRGLLLSALVTQVACGDVRRVPGSDQSDPAGDGGGSQADAGGGEVSDGGDGVDQPDAGEPDDVDAGTPVSPTSPGDIIISEIHKNPGAVEDLLGEWFEVHNPTELTFDLDGLAFTDLSDPPDFFLAPATIIPPGGTLLFAADNDPLINGGLDPDIVWRIDGIIFDLGNTDDEIIVLNPNAPGGEVEIDRVQYDVTFPNIAGVSMSLDPALLDVEGNDAATSWCDGATRYGDPDLGDVGTPGSFNQPCP